MSSRNGEVPDVAVESGEPAPTGRSASGSSIGAIGLALRTGLAVAIVVMVWATSMAWGEYRTATIERIEDAVMDAVSSVVSEQVEAENLLEHAERDAAWYALSDVLRATDISDLVGTQLLRFESEAGWVRRNTGEAREVVRLLEDARAVLVDAKEAFKAAAG